MFCSYYKRLVTSPSYKIRLNCKAYSKVSVTLPSIEKRTKRAKKNETGEEKSVVPPEYVEYFGAKKMSLLELFPRRLFRKTQKPPEIFYLVGNDTSKRIAAIVNKISNPDTPLIEINPGIGTLTEHFLKLKTNNIQLLEVNDMLYKHCQQTFGQRIPCHRVDFCGLWRLAYIDKQDNGDRVPKLLEIFPKKDWKDDFSSRIIVSTGSLAFYKHLIISVLTSSTLFSHGRHEIYAVIPPILYFLLTSTNQLGYIMYRSVSVLFQILFEFEFITKLDRNDFLPWPSKKARTRHSKLYDLKAIDADSLYFVKIVPRKNIFDHCPQDQMNMLNFFIKQNCISRKNRIIPALERWIPYAGREVILASGRRELPSVLYRNESLPDFSAHCYELSNKDFYPEMNIFTEFGDLSPNQMLTLFNTFRNLEGFNDSSFVSNMELQLMKQETTSEETINEIEQAEDEMSKSKNETVSNS